MALGKGRVPDNFYGVPNDRDSIVQSGENLFWGFEPDLVRSVVGNQARAVDDLSAIDGVKEVFVGMQADPARSRSVFVANEHERALLARGQMLPLGFEDTVFPRTEGVKSDAAANILMDPTVRVAGVNTAWTDDAVRRWLDTAINNRPNKGRVGIIGLGNIGQNTLNALITNSAYLAQHGVKSPLRTVNVFHDPHPEYRARVLEARHINNQARVKINTFEESEIDDFYSNTDIVLFIVSKGIPPVEIVDPLIDVRMLQFNSNLNELRRYINNAERAGFRGTFVVVSDPPEHLATAIHYEMAERLASGVATNGLIGNHQVVAEAGMINYARAEHTMAGLDEQRAMDGAMLQDFRSHGYVFGPHGRGLLVANDVRPGRFDSNLSAVASVRTGNSNFEVRALGKLPFTAPGMDQALAVGRMLDGKDLPISVGLYGVVSGLRARLHDLGAFEIRAFPDVDPRLVVAAKDSYNLIDSTTAVAAGIDGTRNPMPLRPTAFWANGVITGDALLTRIEPMCSGRDIMNWNANIVAKHHFANRQGRIYLPEDDEDVKALVDDTMAVLGDERSYKVLTEDDGTRGEKPNEDLIHTNRLVNGVGVVNVKKIRNPKQFNLEMYRTRFQIFLQVDVEVDNVSAIDLVKKLKAEGGMVLGFTPRTHSSSPVLHFGFIGDRVGIDRESPTLPLRSTLTGFEKAAKHLEHWRVLFDQIKEKVAEGFGLAVGHRGAARRIAPDFRDQVIVESKREVRKDSVLKAVLPDKAQYDLVPSMYEHISYVIEAVENLVAILGVESEVDETVIRRMAALHDLGKAVYLRLNHYYQAMKLQSKCCAGDEVRALDPDEIGKPSTHWKYGLFIEDLRKGNKIELPEELREFADFLNPETGEIAKDTEISKRILAKSNLQEKQPELNAALMRFYDLDTTFDPQDLYALIVELADNLSDYGRLNDLNDILKYLGYKEAYALKRYGQSEEARLNIELKFANLRTATIQLYERNGKNHA